jgi:hypothetical protein
MYHNMADAPSQVLLWKHLRPVFLLFLKQKNGSAPHVARPG